MSSSAADDSGAAGRVQGRPDARKDMCVRAWQYKRYVFLLTPLPRDRVGAIE